MFTGPLAGLNEKIDTLFALVLVTLRRFPFASYVILAALPLGSTTPTNRPSSSCAYVTVCAFNEGGTRPMVMPTKATMANIRKADPSSGAERYAVRTDCKREPLPGHRAEDH